jgi:hypothetical protein
MLWKEEGGVEEGRLGGGYLRIYGNRKEAMDWVVVVFKIAFHIFGNLGATEAGPTGGSQPGVCMNHRSYHLHMATHLHIIYK